MTAATRFEQLQTVGVWDADQAWKIGRYHLAQLRLRPETHSWGQDIQHLAYTRGNTVELSHDVILVGLKWGRITAITVNGANEVTSADVDELLLMEVAKSYALKIQRQDGTITTEAIDTVSPSTQTVTFTTPIAQHDYGSGLESGIKIGDHFTFGESGAESIEVKITRIEPQGGLKAQVTAVPAAENIFDAWTGTIPTFDPVITDPIDPTLLPPVQPSIEAVRAESPPGNDGVPRLRIVIAFSMPPGLTGVSIDLRYRGNETITGIGEVVTQWNYQYGTPIEAGVVYLYEIEPGLTYDLQIRARRGSRASQWTATEQFDLAAAGWPGASDNIPNIIPLGYGDFESAEIEDFVVLDTQGSTVSIGTDGGALGSHYIKVVCPNAGMGAYDSIRFALDQQERVIKVDPGRRYVVTAEFYAEDADALDDTNIQFAMLGSGGSAVSSAATLSGAGVGATGEWQQLAFEMDATGETNTEYQLGMYWFNFDTPTGATTPTFRVDKLQLLDVTDRPEIQADV